MKCNNFGLISVIMAAYNAEATIEQSIRSVLRQTYKNLELIVIDDCSKDRTVEIVNRISMEDCRVKLLRNSKNSGVSYTRKNGLDIANGDWIAILDSDDEWLPEKLEKQIVLQNRTNAELLYTGSAFMDESGNRLNWNLQVPLQLEYKQLLKQNLISNSSALVRKKLYSEYYAIGDDMHEDFATWLKILKGDVVAYGVNEPLLIYRLARKSKSGNKIVAAKMNWKTYRFIGLNVFEALYYEFWYVIRGLMKYRRLK